MTWLASTFQVLPEPRSPCTSHRSCSAPVMLSVGSFASSIVAAWSLRYCRVSSTCTLARPPKRNRRYRRMSSPRGVASRRSGMCS